MESSPSAGNQLLTGERKTHRGYKEETKCHGRKSLCTENHIIENTVYVEEFDGW